MTKSQISIYKTLFRKQTIEKHESDIKLGINSDLSDR